MSVPDDAARSKVAAAMTAGGSDLPHLRRGEPPGRPARDQGTGWLSLNAR